MSLMKSEDIALPNHHPPRDHGRGRDPEQSPKKESSFITAVSKTMGNLKNAAEAAVNRSRTTEDRKAVFLSKPVPPQPSSPPMLTLSSVVYSEGRDQAPSSSSSNHRASGDADVYQIRAPPRWSSHDDTGPSPTNVLTAVMRVKSAVNHFATTLISDMNIYPEELKHLKQRIHDEVQGHVNRANHWKYLVQSFVCQRMFEGFDNENGFFGIEQFDDLKMSKLSSFADFTKYKDKAATISGLFARGAKDTSFLGRYCFKKFKSICVDPVTKQSLGIYEQEWRWVEEERHVQSEFYQSFLKVAVSVWLLHSLVHSFEQGWKMLGWETFPKGNKFQKKTMEPVVPGGYEDEDNETGSEVNTVVGFLVIPGFQVSRSVVKCEVYVRKNNVTDGKTTEVRSRSLEKSSSYMTPSNYQISANYQTTANYQVTQGNYLIPLLESSMDRGQDKRDCLSSSSVCSAHLYLQDAEESAKAVQKMSDLLKFNNEQCKYLCDKLGVVVQSACSVLIESEKREVGTTSRKDDPDFVKIFELLMVLGKQVESFVEGCCKEKWVQAAMLLSNVSKYVSSLGFNLDLCKVALGKDHAASGCLTLDEVDGMKKSEAEVVKQKASVDAKVMFEKVIFALNSLHGEDRDLASYLLQRLLEINHSPSSKTGTFLSNLFAWVESGEQVGRGGSATIFKAVWLGTRVAKKTFKGSENVNFEKEVDILSRLCHPNITSMFCWSKNKRHSSIIMELMDGDLNQLIDERCEASGDFRPFHILEAVDIMLQIGEGVNYLHSQGIVHCDLKSTNILYKNVMGKNDAIGFVHVKVGDFGISKARDMNTTYSDFTCNTGTNRWMSPEVIRLSDRKQGGTPSSSEMLPKYPFKLDSYGFGLVCYEILVGSEPFWECANPNVVKRRILNKVRPILPCNPSECPVMLKALIEKCWSHEPEERPAFGVICRELTYIKYSLMTGGSMDYGVDSKITEVRSRSPEMSFLDNTPANYLIWSSYQRSANYEATGNYPTLSKDPMSGNYRATGNYLTPPPNNSTERSPGSRDNLRMSLNESGDSSSRGAEKVENSVQYRRDKHAQQNTSQSKSARSKSGHLDSRGHPQLSSHYLPQSTTPVALQQVRSTNSATLTEERGVRLRVEERRRSEILREEIAASLRDEISAIMREEIAASLRDKIAANLRDEIAASLREEVAASLRDEIAASLREEIGASLKDEERRRNDRAT